MRTSSKDDLIKRAYGKYLIQFSNRLVGTIKLIYVIPVPREENGLLPPHRRCAYDKSNCKKIELKSDKL